MVHSMFQCLVLDVIGQGYEPNRRREGFSEDSRGTGKPVQSFVDSLMGIMNKDRFRKYFLLIVLCVCQAPASGHVMNRKFLAIIQNLDLNP